MSNTLNGEVDFPVGNTTYRLRLSINQLIEVEEITGLGIVQLATMFADPENLRAGHVRAVLWGALRQHHPEINLLGAGEIMTEARLQPTIEFVGLALQAAFPKPEGKESPSPAGDQAGTGKVSS